MKSVVVIFWIASRSSCVYCNTRICEAHSPTLRFRFRFVWSNASQSGFYAPYKKNW